MGLGFYPPGVSAYDPNAPWNQDAEGECSHCQKTIHIDNEGFEWKRLYDKPLCLTCHKEATEEDDA